MLTKGPIRTCELCLKDYPVANFPNLAEGLICGGCMRGTDTTDIDDALRERARLIAVDLSSMSPDDVVGELPRVTTVLAEVYRDFGGPAHFSAHFYSMIMELSKRRPLPASVAQLMLNFMKLHHTIEQTDEAVSARQMTDEQLRRETELATIKLVVDSAGDPAKRQMLEQILAKNGLSLQDADPDELMQRAEQELLAGNPSDMIEEGVNIEEIKNVEEVKRSEDI